MGSSEDWREVTSALGGRFRCLAMDLPGHGGAVGLQPEAYTIEGAARTVLDRLDAELGVERPALVGYSMGGRLALYLALRHPERCAGLFVESASPGLEDAAQRRARREDDEQRARVLETGDLDGFLASWYRQPLFASLARREGMVEALIDTRRRNDPRELARSLRGMGTGSQPPLWGELAWLRIPTLAVAGGLDQRYVGIANRMASSSPRVRSAVVPGAGHNVRLEAPEAYLAALQGFLQTL